VKIPGDGEGISFAPACSTTILPVDSDEFEGIAFLP